MFKLEDSKKIGLSSMLINKLIHMDTTNKNLTKAIEKHIIMTSKIINTNLENGIVIPIDVFTRKYYPKLF
jgi:hypothetical protein